MQQRKALAAAALLGLGLVSSSAWASAPAGVWVKVRQVVYEPNAASPTRVQVHGALMLFDGSSDASRPYAHYTLPALGYVYYECPAGQAEICRQEWSDLEANIAKPENECVGFGWDSLPTGTLRQPGSVVANPDVYPIQNGVSSGFSPCQVIGQFLSSNPGGAGGAASSAGAGGTSLSTGGMGGKAPTSGGAGTSASESGGKAVVESDGGSTASGSGGTTGTGKGGATAGRAGSKGANLEPEEPAKAEPVESKSFGCSVSGATGAASLLGLGAALGLVGLALARRHRSRK
ncbi:MAG TPA: hypothetical protein VHP33_39620 [Polyangiaceae bacterium]|nr:hypothetical protein [Polyangiaceae bacterium]